MLTYDTLMSQFIDLLTEEQDKRFAQGAIALVMVEQMGIKPAIIGSNSNRSASYVRQLVKTFQAFPNGEDRVPELSFQHHKLAAYSDRPAYWIRIASERELSSRELGKLIKGEVVIDELRAAERACGAVTRVIEEGGEGAKYLIKKLEELLSGLHTTFETKEKAEEEVEANLHAVS